ncbi:MAG: ABC transporter permease [Oscillospiraceae bacterium]|nr:ABC transporter permease [Oscillospiraceae bacterium]
MNIYGFSLKSFQKNMGKGIIFIIVLAVILMTSVLNIATSLHKMIYDDAVSVAGDAHVEFLNITIAQADFLSSQQSVEWSNLQLSFLRTWGLPLNSDNVINILYMEKIGNLAGFRLQSGHAPKEENEVVIPPHTAHMLGINLKPGEKFTIQLQNPDKIETSYEFTVSGILNELKYFEANELNYIFVSEAFALSHGRFIEEYGQDSDPTNKKYDMRTIFLHFKDGYNIRETAKELGTLAGIKEADINFNERYLSANLQDPTTVLAIAIILFILILTGVIVIYNAFNIVIIKRTHQYGLLTLIGASKRQIRTCVYIEAVLSACLALPIGMILGSGFGYFSIPIVERIAQGDMAFYAVPWTYGLTILLTIAMVFIGVLRPAFKASKVTPVEAVRFSYVPKIKNRKTQQDNITLSVLVRLNLNRSRGRTIGTVLALSISGTLLLIVSMIGLSMYSGVDNLTSGMVAGDIQVLTGIKRGNTYYYPKKNQLTDDILNKIKNIEGVNRVDVFAIQDYCDYNEENDSWNHSGNIIGMEDATLKDLLKHTTGNVSLDDLKKPGNALTVTWGYYNNIGVGNYEIGQVVNASSFNFGNVGGSFSFNIVGLIDQDDFPPYNPLGFGGIPTLILPMEAFLQNDFDSNYKSACLYIDDDKYDSIEKELTEILKPYDELYFKSHKMLIEEYKNQIMGLIMLILAAVSIVALIGILNLISLVFIGIEQRKKEFGVLFALGLSKIGLKKLLRFESIWVSILSLILSIILGLGIGYGLYSLLVTQATYLVFTFPFIPIIILCIIYVVVPLIITRIAINHLSKLTTTELLGQME